MPVEFVPDPFLNIFFQNVLAVIENDFFEQVVTPVFADDVLEAEFDLLVLSNLQHRFVFWLQNQAFLLALSLLVLLLPLLVVVVEGVYLVPYVVQKQPVLLVRVLLLVLDISLVHFHLIGLKNRKRDDFFDGHAFLQCFEAYF